jgi:ribonuclease BN (tRNA processing enzyme)
VCLSADILAPPLLQLHVYGPRGLAQFINAMLRVSDTYLLMPVVIHELGVQPPSLAGWPPHEVCYGA